MIYPMVISMIAVGEQTGGLDEMLTKIADFYDDEVEAAVGYFALRKNQAHRRTRVHKAITPHDPPAWLN